MEGFVEVSSSFLCVVRKAKLNMKSSTYSEGAALDEIVDSWKNMDILTSLEKSLENAAVFGGKVYCSIKDYNFVCSLSRK